MGNNITSKGRVITKVYHRRRVKIQSRDNIPSTEQELQPVFGNGGKEDMVQTPLSGKQTLRKRERMPPLSDDKLRRSTRIVETTDGCKMKHITDSTGPVTRSRAKLKTNTPSQGTRSRSKANAVRNADDSLAPLPNLLSDVEFPGLKDLEETQYPEISASVLQRVAVERCGINPAEVPVELLLASSKEAGALATPISDQ